MKIKVGDRVELIEGDIKISGTVIDDPEGLLPFKEKNPGRELVMVELDEPLLMAGNLWNAMACFVDKLTQASGE